MKLSNCRVVRSSTQPAENPRILPQIHSRSNPTSRTPRRNHRENEQTHRVPSQMQRRRRAHQHQRRRNRPDALMSSKPQRTPRQRYQTRWSSQKRSALHWPYHRQKAHRASARTMCAPGQNRSSRRAHRHQRRMSRPIVPMSSKPQKRAKQCHQTRWSSQKRSAQHRPYRRQKAHRTSAQRIYTPGQNRNSRRAYRHPRRRNRGDARMCGWQRNPAQKNRLRGIIFIQSSRKSGLQTIYRQQSAKSRMCRKSAVRRSPKLYQQNHPLSVM